MKIDGYVLPGGLGAISRRARNASCNVHPYWLGQIWREAAHNSVTTGWHVQESRRKLRISRQIRGLS
jgi:hypothetical protein